jgi:hypothetical protein
MMREWVLAMMVGAGVTYALFAFTGLAPPPWRILGKLRVLWGLTKEAYLRGYRGEGRFAPHNRYRLQRAEPPPPVVDGGSEHILREWPNCHRCGGNLHYQGPSGGASSNMLCGACGQKINICPGLFAEEIGYDERVRDLYLANRDNTVDNWAILRSSPKTGDAPVAPPSPLTRKGRNLEL